MANWCNNRIIFEGKPEKIEQIQQLFKALYEKQKQENCGQLPDFMGSENGGYFFYIDLDYGEYEVRYLTKWFPNIEVVEQIAKHYNVDFMQEYEEIGWCIYGKAIFTNGILTDTHLKYEEFGNFDFNKETNTCLFEGEEYESEYNILEILLERKIENQFNNN